jgi:tripartite-type tricarboxylate transporter receptor subunit TctC
MISSLLLYSLRGAFTALACLLPVLALSQEYPGKPVRFVVPFETGAPDTIARVVAQQVTSQWGRSVIVENRPGANGIIGAEAVARAAPDGYTLLVTSTSITVNPSIHSKLPFDLERDFVPVTNLAIVPALLLVVNPAVPASSLQELIAYAKSGNAKLAYGSPGHGNQLHVANELFNQRAGLNMIHIPYKGAGPAIAGLVAGDIQAMLITAPLSLPHVRSGRLRALAYTSAKRASFLPEVPTMAEAGIKDLELDGGWFGLFAPSKTPKDALARLETEVKAALANPAVRERFTSLGVEPVGNSSADFAAFVRSETKTYAERVRITGIKGEQ